MASLTSHPLLDLPLPNVANILSQLDSVNELRRTILSHRIFRDAFKDNLHTVSRQIVRNQIPDVVLPYALALLTSSKIQHADDKAIQELLKQLEHHVSNYYALDQDLASLSVSDCAFLSESYTVVDALRRSFVEETVPQLDIRLEIRDPSIPTQKDKFRLDRAFFRYQIMCNLFCTLDKSSPLADQSQSKFFSLFSPWTNEQLMCIYVFLERKVCDAFEDLASHDVEWGELPVDWSESPDASERIQWLLTRGLSCLAAIVNSNTYEDRAELIRLDDFMTLFDDCYPSMLRYLEPISDDTAYALRLDSLHDPLSSYTPDQFSKLGGVLDGRQDSPKSTPFIIWREAHIRHHLSESVFESNDWNLWICGYVLWDFEGIPPPDLRIKCQQARAGQPQNHRLRDDWLDEEIKRSEWQRTDIYLAGGRGYWPQSGDDFSRIRGLSGEAERRLIEKWEHKLVGAS